MPNNRLRGTIATASPIPPPNRRGRPVAPPAKSIKKQSTEKQSTG